MATSTTIVANTDLRSVLSARGGRGLRVSG
jgi:hypothetical protein